MEVTKETRKPSNSVGRDRNSRGQLDGDENTECRRVTRSVGRRQIAELKRTESVLQINLALSEKCQGRSKNKNSETATPLPQSGKDSQKVKRTRPSSSKLSVNALNKMYLKDKHEHEYTIDRLLDVKGSIVGQRMFKIKWEGYSEEDATWEPEKGLKKSLVKLLQAERDEDGPKFLKTVRFADPISENARTPRSNSRNLQSKIERSPVKLENEHLNRWSKTRKILFALPAIPLFVIFVAFSCGAAMLHSPDALCPET